jgi:hypothetical protein
MQLMTSIRSAMSLQVYAVLLLGCSMAVACEPDEPLDGDDSMVLGGQTDASTTANPRDAASTNPSHDAGPDATGGAGGGDAGGGNAGGGNAGGGNAGGGNAGGGNAGGGNAGGGNAGGGASGLDAGASDAGSIGGGVVIGPSMRRDGGPARWDPDAAGPILNAESQAACMTLVQNVCTRLTDCEVMLAGLSASRRNQVLESCRMSFLRSHNCNRAVATASGFAACSDATKARACVEVFASDIDSYCVDQITFQR